MLLLSPELVLRTAQRFCVRALLTVPGPIESNQITIRPIKRGFRAHCLAERLEDGVSRRVNPGAEL